MDTIRNAHRPDIGPHGAHDTEGPTVMHLGHDHCGRCGRVLVPAPDGRAYCPVCVSPMRLAR